MPTQATKKVETVTNKYKINNKIVSAIKYFRLAKKWEYMTVAHKHKSVKHLLCNGILIVETVCYLGKFPNGI